jgi:fructokinase
MPPHNPRVRIGIDLGGTKIAGVALDGSRELGSVRGSTPRGDYHATIEAIAGVVAELEWKAGQRGTVGVGIPGTLSPVSGVVKNANSVWLNGRPFLADLESRLARPVRVANDANCLAVSEAADGAAAGANIAFAVIVGTGTGAGVTVAGRLLVGRHGIAGEWGHNPLPWAEAGELPGHLAALARRRQVAEGPARVRVDFEDLSPDVREHRHRHG